MCGCTWSVTGNPLGADAKPGLVDHSQRGSQGPVPDVASGRIYGPYLRAIPSLPLGSRKGTTGFGDTPPGSADVGWFYDGTTGKIWAALDLDEQDVSGTPWSMY